MGVYMGRKELTNEEALQNFLLDIGCLDELLPWTGKFNLFDVLKITRAEIRHSNMLGWLLNPNENHGLGDTFLRGILQRLVENDSDGRYDVFNVLLMDLYSFSVMREWKNIDILLTSSDEKTVIAIENKVGSHEHSNQLNRYREILEQEYPEYSRLCVFLTPDGETPSDVENWDILSYNDVVEVLEEVNARIKILPDVDLMIKNYIDIVRRDIVEDQQLIDICNKIYNNPPSVVERKDADANIYTTPRIIAKIMANIKFITGPANDTRISPFSILTFLLKFLVFISTGFPHPKCTNINIKNPIGSI